MSQPLSLFAPQTAQQRHDLIRMPQQQRVLDALFSAYPNTISHAELCKRVGTNRVSHRIAELIAEGWQIDGLGVLPLDEETQTQLYRLTSVEKDTRTRRLAGWTIRWDTAQGLRVSVHKRLSSSPLPRARLAAVVPRIEALLREEFPELVQMTSAVPQHVGAVLDALQADADQGDEE